MIDDRDDRESEAPLEPRLAELAQAYHRPPAGDPPRDAMWAAIAAARARRRAAPRVLPLRHWRLGIGIAALLVLGVALGRWSATFGGGAAEPAVAEAEAPFAYQLAATQYLSRTEVLLTNFRARRGTVPDGQFLAAARELLTLTRMMKDSPAAADPALRTLLEDLELVLVQLVQLTPGAPPSPDAELITQGMEERGLLPRLRTAIPAGPAAAGRAGVS